MEGRDWSFVRCDKRPVQMLGMITVIDLVRISSHLLLCAVLMNKLFLYYIKLPSNQPYIIIYFIVALNNLEFLQQSGLSFWFLASLLLISCLTFSFSECSSFWFLWFILHNNICCLFNTYCVPDTLYRICSPHSTSIMALCSLFYRWEELRLRGILTCWSQSGWYVTELGHESRPVWLQAHSSLENALFSPNTWGMEEAVWGGGGCSWGMLTVLWLAPENQPLYSPIIYMEII